MIVKNSIHVHISMCNVSVAANYESSTHANSLKSNIHHYNETYKQRQIYRLQYLGDAGTLWIPSRAALHLQT